MENSFDSLLKYGLRILGKRDYTVFQIRKKIEKRCDDDRIKDKVVDYLISINALNDDRFCKNFIDLKILNGWGPKKIKFELMKRGISEELVDKYLKIYTLEQIKENIKKNIDKWIRIRGQINDNKDFEKLYKHLYRLGFDSDRILDILKVYKKSGGE